MPAGPPRTVIPVHYEGWTHFRQGRGAIKQQFEQAPADIGRRLQWLPIGASIGIAGVSTPVSVLEARWQNASLRP